VAAYSLSTGVEARRKCRSRVAICSIDILPTFVGARDKGKGNVKFTLEQATKAQKCSRGIALLSL